jgi:predicted PurR-regulated permease PerM
MFRPVAGPAAQSAAIDELIPPGVRLTAAWAWRVVIITVALTLLGFALVQVREILIPVLVAMVLSALLVPFRDFLRRRLRFPRWAAIATAELGVIAAVALLLYLVVTQVAAGFGGIRDRALGSLDSLSSWLASSFHLGGDELAKLVDQLWQALQANAGNIVPSVLSTGSAIGHIVIGVLLALFTTLFILIDGKRIWSWILRLFPRRARFALDGAGRSGWLSLQSFVKVQILVAFIDAVGIAGGAALLGVPFAISIGVLVFLGSFIPVVGAILTGAVAVAIALIYNEWLFIAVLMLAIVLLVQQFEGHVLQPLIMGNAVKVHPLAVILAVAAGSMLAGIPGAFFAVPVVAVLNSSISYIAGGQWRKSPSSSSDHTNRSTSGTSGDAGSNGGGSRERSASGLLACGCSRAWLATSELIRRKCLLTNTEGSLDSTEVVSQRALAEPQACVLRCPMTSRCVRCWAAHTRVFRVVSASTYPPGRSGSSSVMMPAQLPYPKCRTNRPDTVWTIGSTPPKQACLIIMANLSRSNGPATRSLLRPGEQEEPDYLT